MHESWLSRWSIRYDGFINTDLEESLKERKTERVVVCGVMTDWYDISHVESQTHHIAGTCDSTSFMSHSMAWLLSKIACPATDTG